MKYQHGGNRETVSMITCENADSYHQPQNTYNEIRIKL